MTPERYARIKELFLQAVDLEEAERANFLASISGDDPQLRQEVESLLAHHNPRTILPTDSNELRDAHEERNADQRFPKVKKLGPKGQLALGAALCAVLLGLFGWWQRGHVLDELHRGLGKRMRGMLEAHIAAFENWAELQHDFVESWAPDPEFRSYVQQLASIAEAREDDYIRKLKEAPEQAKIRSVLRTFGGKGTDYVIWNHQQEIIAESAQSGAGIGKLGARSAARNFSYAIRGETTMFVGNTSDIMRDDYAPEENIADVFVATPILGDEDQIIAVAAFFNLETALLMHTVTSFSQVTDTSETYAFNKAGLMLSDSRFEDELRKYGVIPESASHSSLLFKLRDPGGDLTAGYEPSESLSSRPLTHMARHAIAGEGGQDLDGYRNYLGQTVVGVWRWLPEFDFGFAMEMSWEESYRSVKFVERQFLLSFSLLVASAAGVLISFYWIGHLRRLIGKDRQLGQYTLGDLIGEGGMGRVYRGHHALLKRPCAIKLLKPELMNRQSLTRFEREVQLAATLTHPNTIEIFDYGTSSEGVFYYVMEYLQGLDLQQLVAIAGPLPWTRAVFILKQVGASLREAHQLGLVHRDIKPQNIMLCQLGGEADFAKVLDFGLAKEIDSGVMNVTAPGILAGTPVYMAPERWSDPSCMDARADIFSFGAVAYHLLSGHDAFGGDSPAAVMQNVLTREPQPLSDRAAVAMPDALDQLVMDCLAKDVDARPNNIDDVLTKLSQMDAVETWDRIQAERWWSDEIASARTVD